MAKEKIQAVWYWIKLLGVMAAIVAYSLSAFAYIQTTFVSKDSFSIICQHLDKLEAKIDKLEDKIDQLKEKK